MNKESLLEFWNKCRKIKLNKYVIVLMFFLCIFMIDDEQSIWCFIRRYREIHRTEHMLKKTRTEDAQCEINLQTLQNTDSLERYAREHYYMHAPNEDVYLVTE